MTAAPIKESSVEALKREVLALEHKLRAKDKIIGVLIQRVENSTPEGHSAAWVLEQNVVLEKMVAKRTAEIRAKKQQLSQALAQLQGAQTQLIQAQKLEAIGQLAAGIAHEVNTPTQYVSDNAAFAERAVSTLITTLHAALTVVEAAKQGPVEPALIEAAEAAVRKAKLPYLLKQLPLAIEQAREGLERITSIVQAMKEFSHPCGPDKKPIDVKQAIATTLAVARNEWKYVADVQVDIDSHFPLVPALRNEFNQVILNLVVNAAHAISERNEGGTHGKGLIRIVGVEQGDHVQIRVCDNGAGIPEAVRSRIFEPFFTTKSVGKGTGQGLAIAHSVIVDKHQGSLHFETEVGRGTTFVITLPLDDPAPVPSASREGA